MYIYLCVYVVNFLMLLKGHNHVSHQVLTSISGLNPLPSVSPSSTCHPEGISTETTAVLRLDELSAINKETSR